MLSSSVHSLVFKRRCVFILDLCFYFVLLTQIYLVCTILSVYIQDEYLVMREACEGGGCGDDGLICTKQKLSQILLLCGMDQKNGVTSITKDKER